jgi:hypothetical protein
MTISNYPASRLLAACRATLAMIGSVIPAPAASNGKIVFKSGRNSTNGIWVMNPDGTGATSLISDTALPLQGIQIRLRSKICR